MAGVASVIICSMIGVATLLLKYPNIFWALKLLGGAYLIFIGLQLWRSRGRMAVQDNVIEKQNNTRKSLALQVFITTIANPKGWAFFIALLPFFIDNTLPLLPQLSILLVLF